MPIITEMFDQHKVDLIKRQLQREIANDRPKDFEIIIDGFKVVSRTSNIEEFDDYEEEITEKSQNLTILVYTSSNANRNTRYSFTLQGDSRKATATVSGLGEIDQVIAQKMEEKEREFEFSRLKEQLLNTKAQLAEAEEYADKLQDRIKDMEDKRYTNAISIGEVASVVLKSLVKQHAARIPGGQALAGLLGADLPDELPVAQHADARPVSFEKAPDTPVLDEQTQNRLSLIQQMQERFNEPQMVAVFSIIDVFATKPETIEPVLVQLGIQNAPIASAA